jgi:hypothetical protein
MTITVAFFNCPHCVDSFAFDFQKLKSLTLHSRVSVRCPGCQNVAEVVTNAYALESYPPSGIWILGPELLKSS